MWWKRFRKECVEKRIHVPHTQAAEAECHILTSDAAVSLRVPRLQEPTDARQRVAGLFERLRVVERALRLTATGRAMGIVRLRSDLRDA